VDVPSRNTTTKRAEVPFISHQPNILTSIHISHLHLSVSGIICLPITEVSNAEDPLSLLLLLFSESRETNNPIKISHSVKI